MLQGKTKKKKGGAKLAVSKNNDELEAYGDYADDYDDFIWCLSAEFIKFMYLSPYFKD